MKLKNEKPSERVIDMRTAPKPNYAAKENKMDTPQMRKGDLDGGAHARRVQKEFEEGKFK